MGIINTKYSTEDVKIDEIPFFSGTASYIPETIIIPRHELISDNVLELKKKEERKLERDHRLHLFGRIYKISNTVDNLTYIGSTVGGVEDRFTRHKKDARNDSTWALHLHMRALGFEQFTIIEIDVVELVTLDELHVIESKYMSMYRSVFDGLNSQYASRMCYHGLAPKQCKDCNIGIACEHYFNWCLCFNCKYIKQSIRICWHYKMHTCCHLCNKCKYCDAIYTKEHKLTNEHIQHTIKADELEALRDHIREQKCLQSELYEHAGFSLAQFKLLTMHRNKRLGKITLQKLNRKQVDLVRSAWEVYLESVNQADN